MNAINRIYQNLQNGKTYGYDVNSARFPYFSYTLTLSPDRKFIRWRYYGESANANTIKDLQWIIEIIFKMTPEEFENKYYTRMEA